MKKIFIIAFSILFVLGISSRVFALSDGEDVNSSGTMEDMYQHTGTFDNAFSGQKKITDEEYKKTLDQVIAKQNKKKKINQPYKGKNYNSENNGGYLDETAEKNLLLSVPVTLVNGDGAEIPIGMYKIVGKKVDGKAYLDFYQSSTLVAHVPAIETNYDFDKMAVNFVEWNKYDEKRIRVIYGSMDFNAYTFLKMKIETQNPED